MDDSAPTPAHEEPWDVGTTSVVLLGAGFSRAVSDGQMPLMAGFFDRLDRRKHKRLHSFLHDVFGAPDQANVEDALVNLDQLSDSPLQGRSTMCRRWSKHGPAVRAELGAYALERLAFADIHDDNWAANVLAQAGDETTVLTTNYDNLAERILSNRTGITHGHGGTNCPHCRMCRILLDNCECGPSSFTERPDWRGSLIKLHGSVAWHMCTNGDCLQHECLVPDPHCRPISTRRCQCCCGNCDPVMVLPTTHKSYERYREIKRMWDAAHDALSDARSLLVFGFSFPTCDALIAQMVRETAVAGRRLSRVGVIDVAPDAVIERIRSCLPRDLKLQIDPLPVPRDGSPPRWLMHPADAGSSPR